MGKSNLCSIIINNYNYGCFLKQAIDSALNQSYSNVEVIVVDDGSTDNSRDIMEHYTETIVSVFKENGGQISACYAGLNESIGDVVIFLDADDSLFQDTVKNVMVHFHESKPAKVHWHMVEINNEGALTGRKQPAGNLINGYFRQVIIEQGIVDGSICPTSGNAWSRDFLLSAFEHENYTSDNHGLDGYLGRLAPLFGDIVYIEKPLSRYRIHDKNYSGGRNSVQKFERILKRCDIQFLIMIQLLEKEGVIVELSTWKAPGTPYDWFRKMIEAHYEIMRFIAGGEKFVLIDEGNLEEDFFPHHQVLPIYYEMSKYYESLLKKEIAKQIIEEWHEKGNSYIVFFWSCFWWLEYYVEFYQYLRSQFECICESDYCIIYRID